MKIAIVSTPFVPVPPPRYGGTELVVATLAEELGAAGHEVVLYATGDSRIEGVEVRWTYCEATWPPSPWHEMNQAAFAVRDVVAQGGVDVIHSHVAPVMALAAFVDAPIVYTLHHPYDEPLHDFYRDVTRTTPSATLVAISERQRELLGDDLDAEVVHHGLPPERYALGPGGRYAAYVGRFAEEKGVHSALDAARRARVPLRLAGAPHWKDEAYFHAEVAPRLRHQSVTWIGEASHEPKVRLLGGALATLFPIDWEEPFGLVMIESMLCGTPVIAFARGSASEVVDPGVTGWVVSDVEEMAERLAWLARHPRTFDRAACRQRAAARFSGRVMVERYLSIYARAMGRTDLSEVQEWAQS